MGISWKNGPTVRVSWPPGGSILTTSAPISASSLPHHWPFSSVSSSTRIPEKGPSGSAPGVCTGDGAGFALWSLPVHSAGASDSIISCRYGYCSMLIVFGQNVPSSKPSTSSGWLIPSRPSKTSLLCWPISGPERLLNTGVSDILNGAF